MAYAWQSVEEAAVTLGVSTRTLHRRISKGEVETRLEEGRREVLVCLPDEEEFEVEGFEEPIDTSPSHFTGQSPTDNQTAIILAEKEVALANEKVRRTELALAAFQHTSSLLQQEASRTRLSARCAWAAVAVLSVGAYIAVGWTASQLTSFRTNNANLTQQLRQATATIEEKSAQAEQYRDQRDRAKESAARVEGELAASKSALAAKKPSTRPSGSFLENLAKLAGD